MKVEHLIRGCYKSISPNSGTLAVKEMLFAQKFLVVEDESGYLGLLTPNDLAKRSFNLVADCLTDKERVADDQELSSVLHLMAASQETALPVFSNERFLGVILRTDILEYLNEETKALEAKVRDRTRKLESSNQSLKEEIVLRKKKEKELRKSKNEWIKTFDAINDLIFILDKDMRIIRANKAAHDVFQVRSGALNGKYCYEVFRGSGTPCPNCPVVATITDGRTHTENIVHENLGKIFSVSCSPILDSSGECTQFVHIARDITSQKKMEEELFQANKMKAIGTLAGGIAHDFNNILAAIIGYTELAMTSLPVGNPARNHIEEVFKAGNRAKELVNQILVFSHKGVDVNEPMQPSLIVKEGLKLLHASLPTTITILQEIEKNSGFINGNPTNIHQVLVNLCTNALHAMADEKGILTVKLNRLELTANDLFDQVSVSPGPFIRLTVSDTGCGMDPDTLERMFEPYYTTKEVGKGTGMGLPLVHGIVQECGGFIKVKSELGRGSTIQVFFPAIANEMIPTVEHEEEEPLPRGNECILAVDDEPTIVGFYRGVLERLGYTVVAHSSSEQVLEEMRKSPDRFDLIITDQTMPHLSGSELSRKILEIRPNIPIILSTGYSSMITEKKAREIGIARFLLKPLNMKELALCVREVLDTHKKTVD